VSGQPAFYECPNCGYFHPAGFNGTCEDIDNRFDPGDLDDTYPNGGWIEAERPGAAKPNLHRLEQLRPDIDLNGNRLEVGCTVRVSSVFYIYDTDVIGGLTITDEGGCYIDGVLEKIGEVIDGTPRYVVRCTHSNHPLYDKRLFNQTARLQVIDRAIDIFKGRVFNPTVNGHQAGMCVAPSKNKDLNGLLTHDPEHMCPAFSVFRLK
jgi:hypothetical protein